jgi:predicted small lipoprotein YifL
MLRTSGRQALLAAAIALALSLPACGKKAPLRLTDDRAAEKAPAPQARVREGRVTLDFRVPAHRTFPEREDPWVLARLLRQVGPSAEVVEAGAILQTGGFVFGAPLRWSDQAQPAKSSFVYRVEFRDAARRRRALSDPLTVSWELVPDAPANLTAVGHLRSIALHWAAPISAGAGTGYRPYRREPPRTEFEPATPEPLTETDFVDSRIEPGRDYCYEVRAVLTAKGLEVEGPASPEVCSSAASEEPPPARSPASAP